MRKGFKTAKILIALALMAALLSGSALAASYSAKVLVSSMDVYGRSDGNVEKIGSLSQGKSFKVTAISGDWARISYKGHTGYAKLEDMIFSKRIKAVAVKDAKLKFVTKKSFDEKVYYTATLSAGTGVYVVGKNDDTFLITNRSGSALGYVAASALSRN